MQRGGRGQIHVNAPSPPTAYRVAMRFSDPAIRAAYRRGARDSYESAFARLDPAVERTIAEWLGDLDRWHCGEPPPPPYAWEQEDPD